MGQVNPPQASGADGAGGGVSDLVARLNSAAPDARQDDRDEAARRLVARPTPEARAAVRSALSNAAPSAGRLAVARAVADVGEADPALVDPLLSAVADDAPRPLVAAALDALGLYQADPRVPDRLAAIADGSAAGATSTATRAAAAEALGKFPTKRAAGRLVGLLDAPDPAVADAAVRGLQGLTARPEVGTTAAAWRAWWGANAAKADADLRADLLADRAVRAERTRRRLAGLQAEGRRLVQQQYRAAAPDARGRLLVGFLGSPEPSVREAGAEIALDEMRTVGVLPDPARDRLRDLVADSDPGVRRTVARALAAINDPRALPGLLDQLSREPDPTVRAAIAGAIAPVRDARAVPALVGLLGDPSPEVAVAAAGALQAVAPAVRDADPQLAGRVGEALRAALVDRPEDAVRQAAAEALAPLRQPQLIPALRDALTNRKTAAPVRRASVEALGAFGNPQLADTFVQALGDADPAVRVAAARALAGSADNFGSYAESLYRRLDPAAEPDEKVRDEAWRALQSLFPAAPRQQLAAWPDRFKDDPRRRLVVLQALAEQYARAGESRDEIAFRQRVGDAHTELREPDRAAVAYRAALDVATSSRAPQMVVLSLNESLLRSLLRGRDYAGGTAFAAGLLRRDPQYQGYVGPILREQVDALSDPATGTPEDARRLIDLVLAMDPPLRDPSLGSIKRRGEEVRRRLADQQRATGPQSAGARAIAGPASG